MSLFESGHSTGSISLGALLRGDASSSAQPQLTVPDIADRICIGGWPGHVDQPFDVAARPIRGYLDEVRRVDVTRVDGRRRDPDGVGRLFRSLARHEARYASDATLAADSGPTDPLDVDTVRAYLAALRHLMVIEDQQPWSPRLRSRSRLRGTPKRRFVDPSLAVAALRLTPSRLLDDIEFMGFLFESMVVRDLRIYSEVADAQVFQYRDNTGLEIDAIVETGDGRWAAFEVKLGPGHADEAARSLLRLADRVDTERMGEPAMLGVITGFGYGYQRPDGVAVIPIGALAP